MRALFHCVLAGLAGATVVVASGAGARPLTPAEKRYHPYHAQLPACDDEKVLDTIRARFSERERKYWKSGVEIVGFDRVRERGMRSNGPDYVPRRYCEARGSFSDSKSRLVVYSVIEDFNMTGGDAVRSVAQSLTFGFLPDWNPSPFVNWGIDWCVVGLDRNYAYAVSCKAARP